MEHKHYRPLVAVRLTGAGGASHLPESQEDHQLHHCELQQWVERSQKLMSAHIEEQQSIQCYCVCDVVYDRDPEIPAQSHSFTP